VGWCGLGVARGHRKGIDRRVDGRMDRSRRLLRFRRNIWLGLAWNHLDSVLCRCRGHVERERSLLFLLSLGLRRSVVVVVIIVIVVAILIA
jgi:hypothetical protein